MLAPEAYGWGGVLFKTTCLSMVEVKGQMEALEKKSDILWLLVRKSHVTSFPSQINRLIPQDLQKGFNSHTVDLKHEIP